MFHDHRTQDEKLVQFTPARAKKKLANVTELDKVRAHYSEQKIDGSRYLIQSGRPAQGFQHGCTSRRVSVETGRFVEKTDRVPHITRDLILPEKSIFDNEFVSSGDIVLLDLPGKFWDKIMDRYHPHMVWLKNKFQGGLPVYPHVSNTTAIMGSDAGEALRKQAISGKIWSYCFDIVQFRGQYTGNNPQIKRRNFLAKLLAEVDPESGMILMPAWWNLTREEQEEFFFLVTDLKGEGMIFKDPELGYNHARAWWKLKRDYPADVVLTGEYKMGSEGKTGKMLGKVGSLGIGVYHNGKLHHVGWMSAIMDSEARLTEVTELALQGQLRGRVCEARHNGVQKKAEASLGYTLRHPRWRRWRDDEKNAEDCTSAALLAECSDDGDDDE